MSIEFIGYISNNNSSETIVRQGPILDPNHIETVAKAHENAGFDRVLFAFHSTTPDALQVAQHVLQITKSLKVMIAQRPGFTAPTLLARQLAALDQFYDGRVSLHVITGGNATELRQDGNTLDDKDERYARTGEFLDVMRLEWTSEKPFDYSGKYYTVEKGFSQVKPVQKGGIYTFVGGGSDAAIEVAGKHADTFALWGESYAQVRDVTARCARPPPGMAGRRHVSACRCVRSSPTPKRKPGIRPTRSWNGPRHYRTKPATASPRMATPPPAPGGCSRWQIKARGSTSACGPRLPS
jgi:alkanesulfonate monooxygenase